VKNATAEQREAINRLTFIKDGKVLVAYIEDCLAETVVRMVKDDDASRVRLYQGECRALRVLSELLNPVSSSRTGME
jgi:hypothetical protein